MVLWGFTLVFAVPAVFGIGLPRLTNVRWVNSQLDKVGLGYVDRTPSAWDFVLRQERGGFMRIRLKDGGVIGGEFFSGSFASTTPDRADLDLERAWQLDENGNFAQPLVDGQGIWIAHDTMQYIEFFSQGGRKDVANEHEDGIELPDQTDSTS